MPQPTTRPRPPMLRALVSALVAIVLLGSMVARVPGAQASTGSVSLADVLEEIGAGPLHDQGLTGQGIDIAVIDTGVAPVPGLDGDDKVLVGPDLSFEAGVPELYGQDSYGHGTVMASIIAGNGGPDGFRGVAPDSRILSVKVADNTGAVDVSQVIAAIDWVVENRNQGGLNVRVINLSYVTDSEQSYLIDPLAFAVERAWHAGIVVVVAAGNAGGETETLGNPATDPYVIAVAAASDDGDVADFSNSGSGERRPDVLAPGTRILGLAAPGSRLTQENPSAFIDGRYLRGSGTSQATAVVSGAAALLLQQRPDLTPDQVKALLIAGAVDADGNGQARRLKGAKDLVEFQDLLDEQRTLQLDAEAVRTEASLLRSSAERLDAEASVLRDQADVAKKAKGLKGADKKASKAEAKELERAADELQDEAASLRDAADDLERSLDGIQADIEDQRRDIESAKVPKFLDLETEAQAHAAAAESHRALAVELRAQADALLADAAGLKGKDAKRLEKAADELLRDARDADKDAEKAEADAAKAAEKAQRERLDFEEAIVEAIRDWSGVGFGKISFDDRAGAGLIDVSRSMQFPTLDVEQTHPRATGTGSLDLARGSAKVTLPDGTLLEGEVTFTGASWSGASWSGASWSGASWSGASWSGASWSGASWSGASWSGASWSGASWSGASWSGASWSGASWSGASWSGASWSGASWSGASWSGASWSGASWAGASWAGAVWTGASWG